MNNLIIYLLIIGSLLISCEDPMEELVIPPTTIDQFPLIEEEIDDDYICLINIEVAPRFPGGIKAWTQFLKENLKYPRIPGCWEGVVYAGFRVEKDGSISNVEVLKGPHEKINKEVIRVIELSPIWEPGTMRGKPVKMEMVIPVRFRFN